MRLFLEELPPNYDRYQFGYAQWAELDAVELDVPLLYPQGYLPASHRPFPETPRFYRARSLRVDLSSLAMDKKRRYLQRSLKKEGLDWRIFDKSALQTDPSHQGWDRSFLQWIAQRFDPPFMDRVRLNYLLASPLLTDVATFGREGESPFGYALLNKWPSGAHYWFAAYNPEENVGLRSLGLGMMGAFLQWAQECDLGYAYLGTGYNRKAAYKLQGITGGEWWTGERWSADKEAWMLRLEADEAASVCD